MTPRSPPAKNAFIWLIIANTLIWLVQVMGEILHPGFYEQVASIFALHPDRLATAPWQLFTYMFLHADIDHLGYNMIALFLFGLIAERVVGTRNFLLAYFAGGIVAGIASTVLYPNSTSLGASAAVYTLIGLVAVLRPTAPVFIGAPVPALVLAVIYFFLDVAGIFSPSPDNVAYAAHVVGLGVGVLFGLYWYDKYKLEKTIEQEAIQEISEEELDEWEEKWMKTASAW